MTARPPELDRRAWLAACATLALCAVPRPPRWLRHRAISGTDTPYEQAVLSALVRTILPFEHGRFPRVPPERIEARLLALFPLEERRYDAVRQALVVFDDMGLFPKRQAVLVAEETAAMGATDAAIADAVREDERRYEQFVAAAAPPAAGRFTDLTPASRLEYLRVWSRSAFLGKRRFYRSVKGLVMVSAYSMEELWQAIGYAGPLLARRP